MKEIKAEERPVGYVVRFFVKNYPFNVSLTVVFFFFSGFLEGLSIVVLLPLLGKVFEREETSNGAIGHYFDTAMHEIGIAFTLESLLILFVAAIFGKALFSFIANIQVNYSLARIIADFRLNLLQATMRARWGYFINLPTGHITSATAVETQRVANCYQAISLIVASFFQVAVQISLAFMISWQVTVTAILLGAILIFFLRGLVLRTKRLGVQKTDLLSSLSARLVEAINGMKALKAMGTEKRFLALLKHEIRGLEKNTRRLSVLIEAVRNIPEPLVAFALAVGFYVFSQMWKGEAGVFIVLAILFSRTIRGAGFLQQKYQSLLENSSGFWFVQDLIIRAREAVEDRGGDTRPVFEKSIRLEKVSFAYGSHLVLDNVSLTIPAKGMVTLYGSSGSGKTTLADLISGLHRPHSGEVLIDGVSILQLDLSEWRKAIGYVSQEPLLFHESVLANITLKDNLLTREDAENALKMASAWEFVSDLPEGLNTFIGERGGALSGGQQQRLNIARALIRNPKVLILDEPTTGLDPDSERIICETLKLLSKDMAVLSVSHQPHLAEVADVVYRVENGKVFLEKQPEEWDLVARI